MTRRRHMFLAVGLAAGMFALSAGSAHAWEPIDSSEPAWCETVPYALGQPSSDLGESTTISEVRSGMDEWTTMDCTSLTTSWEGTTGSTAGSRDGVSMIGWVESGWPHGSGAIGVTGPQWNYSGCITEADMQMNGVNYTWVTGSGSGGSVNAFSIIAHEGGHYYGLGHSSDSSAIMYYSYRGGTASINADDREGICTLYPGDGGGTMGECDIDDDCPSGQTCDGGTCVDDGSGSGSGDGTVCSPCSRSSDCGGSQDYCIDYGDDTYCGKRCTSESECGDGQSCVNVGGVGQCIGGTTSDPSCDSGSSGGCDIDSDCTGTMICDGGSCVEPSGGAALGEPCSDPDDCASGRCATTPSGGVCTRSCDWLDTGSCPDGFYCDGDATGICGGDNGICLEGSAGSASLGDACSQDTDCASLYCSDSVCAEPCVPGGATSCPDGLRCQETAISGCGACKESGGVGDSCETNEDCVTRYCAERGSDGSTFCTDICTTREDCPSGFTCESAGDVSVCVPPEDGGIGASCEGNTDCLSGLCTTSNFCTDRCAGDGDCPSDFTCVPAGEDAMVCAPSEDGGGGGRGGGG
ncbi:MAG: matrixin family metalloprotease, partial [Polyangiales bacterium]